MPTPFDILPEVSSRKEYMEALQAIMVAEAPEEGEQEEEIERRGRPRELKSYLLESNSKLPSEFKSDGIQGLVRRTGLDDVKILDLKAGSSSASFYVDMSDGRFWILHTGSLAQASHMLVEQISRSQDYQFDRAWFPTKLLKSMSELPGNMFRGFGLQYQDLFTPEEASEAPIEELTMNVFGTSSDKALNAVLREEELQRSISYNRIRIRRGSNTAYTNDDLFYNGQFSVRSGSSIDDHISLTNEVKSRYRELVDSIEKLRLGTKEINGITHIEGKAFNFTFKREIEDIDFFIKQLLDATSPFKLWGLKSKIAEDYYSLLALDLHTNQPIDLEIAPNLIRLYLPEGTCGNSLLRLYVNLQQYFDSNVQCSELPV